VPDRWRANMGDGWGGGEAAEVQEVPPEVPHDRGRVPEPKQRFGYIRRTAERLLEAAK
jgi:hypothetical protein